MGVASVCELHSSVELSPEPSLRPSAALPLAVPLCAEQTESRSIMGVEGCTKCIKYLLFFFNFIFWVSACVCVCVCPSCWTSSRPPPIYREACSGTRAHIVGSRGSRWGNHGQRGSRGGVVRALCLRNHIVPPRQSVGTARRRAQVGTDQVCDRGRRSLLGLCGRKSQSWKFGVFGVRALCGSHPPVCVCVCGCG